MEKNKIDSLNTKYVGMYDAFYAKHDRYPTVAEFRALIYGIPIETMFKDDGHGAGQSSSAEAPNVIKKSIEKQHGD